MVKFINLIILSFFSISLSHSQNIKGLISDGTFPVEFAKVCKTNTSTCVYTDTDGKFKIEANIYDSLSVTALGFTPNTYVITSNNQTFKLKEKAIELDEVFIKGKTIEEEKKEEPYAVTVIDVEPLKTQNLDVNQVLNSTAGIRIREEGGLGSNFNFSLNGFSGSQVRFFIDGVPMDNFGSSLSLNNIPVNLISRIEIYKGVIPAELGSDALGGAINIVTDKSVKSFADVSYSYGSFNTHRASVLSRYHDDSTGLIVNANAFFNYSDNNYKVQVEIPDSETGKYGDPETVRHFNDGYQSQMGQIELGVVDKKYADRLFLGLIGSSNHKEVQTGANMNQVAGEIYTEDKVLIPTLKYQKFNIFKSGINVNLYANYNTRQALSVDTSSKIYDWRGDYRERSLLSTSGELTWYKTMFSFNDKSFLNTVNLSYEITPQHILSLNNNYSVYTRVGEDPITYGAIPFSEPNTLTKNISSLSYGLNLFEDKLKTVLFAKLFLMDAKTHESTTSGENKVLTDINVNNQNTGYGLATTYHFTKNIQLKASYENTYRLPDAYEMFGNGLLLLPNVNLTPEKSKNFNIGALGKIKLNKNEILLEGGYLYRLPENLIRLIATGVTSEYENLTSAKANVIEGGIKYLYNKTLQIEINGTYQNIVNNEEFTSTGGTNYLYEDRLPNQPFLFGNASAGINFKDVWKEKNALSINWTMSFVEAFYLQWPSQGSRESKFDIPRQFSHGISASYSLKDGQYNISLACTNLFDKALFDNFMLQKPGRAFNIKLRYFLQK